MATKILVGDCRERLAELEADSIHACVTDPPYGLSFMGKDWDHGLPGEPFWREVIRVMKPGAFLLAFGGTRTYHRLTCAIEDAGFEIRDCLMWMFGSGFPKSRNLKGDRDGWGTALKPAYEPIVLARKPLAGTVAANVAEHGTGALNIDGCRIAGETPSVERRKHAAPGRSVGATGWKSPARPASYSEQRPGEQLGRWPANVVHDGSEEVLAGFPDAKGQQGAVTGNEPSGVLGHANCYGRMDRRHEARPRIETDKSAARFFYCAKTSRAERNAGLDGFDAKKVHPPGGDGRCWDIPGSRAQPRANNHPTVKPVALMRYLVRLVTPPGGAVLDPFFGSGTTRIACELEGFDCIGVELCEEYAAIAEARVAHFAAIPSQPELWGAA